MKNEDKAGRGGENRDSRANQGVNRENMAGGRGSNLGEEDRARGGRRSAEMQERDARGHFAGKKSTNSDPAGGGSGR